MTTDTVLMSTDTTPFALHLLGVLCWLYLVGFPRILWVTTQTQLFLTKKRNPCQGSDLSSLSRLILWVTTQTQLFLTPPKKSFFPVRGVT